MNNLLGSPFSTSIPLASVICSILYMIYGNTGLLILAAICVALPAIAFFFIAVYIFFQYGRKATIEVDLDTVQLGLIQLATILLVFNFVVKYISAFLFSIAKKSASNPIDNKNHGDNFNEEATPPEMPLSKKAEEIQNKSKIGFCFK